MADVTAPKPPPDFYVERSLSSPDFVEWLKKTGPEAQREQSPSTSYFVEWLKEPNPKTRLRSIVGPPGSGKTTFLRRLAAQLRQKGWPVLELPEPPSDEEATSLPAAQSSGSEDQLSRWKSAQLRKLVDAGYLQPNTEIPVEPSKQFEQAIDLLARWTDPVLLVDGFDELSPDQRQRVEQQLLVLFLFPDNVPRPNTRVVLTRRDQYGLEDSALRWEEFVSKLKPLNHPEEQKRQIRRRLAHMLATDPAHRRATAEVAKRSTHKIDQDEIAAVVDKLRPSLTSNPFINVALLERLLAEPDEPLTRDDYQSCLQTYVRHAGLQSEFAQILAERVRVLLQKPFSVAEYYQTGFQKELERLVETGIVGQVKDTPLLQFDPAVAKLVQMSSGNPPPASEDSV